MLTDAASLALARAALRVAARPSDRRRTYGYQRLAGPRCIRQQHTACCSQVAWIVYEAIIRLRNPAPVMGPLMLTVAGGGSVFAINVVALVLLRRGDAENLNLRAAYLHVLSRSARFALAALVARDDHHLYRTGRASIRCCWRCWASWA